MPTLEYLARGHENLERLLLVLDSHLSRPLSGEAPDVKLMARICEYVIDYVEGRHNPVEELVLVRLARRDRSFRSVFDVHARELRDLRVRMACFARLLAAASVDPSYDQDELAREGHAFVSALRRRVVAEDTERLPSAARALDAEDWRSIEATIRTRRLRDHPWSDDRCRVEFGDLVRAAGCGCEYSS